MVLANTKPSFSFNPGPFRASNVSHTVVLRPLKAGYFNFTSASVSYVAQEGGEVVVSRLKYPLMAHEDTGAQLFFTSVGRLHQCTRPGRHPGSEGI